MSKFKLSEALDRAKLSQSDLARRLGVVRGAVCNWCNSGVPAGRVFDVSMHLTPEDAGALLHEAGLPADFLATKIRPASNA